MTAANETVTAAYNAAVTDDNGKRVPAGKSVTLSAKRAARFKGRFGLAETPEPAKRVAGKVSSGKPTDNPTTNGD